MLKLVFNGGRSNISLRFRSLILYSTASAPSEQASHLVVDYIANSLGLSRDEAVAASKKVSRSKSPENPIPVIRFFNQLGFSQSQIKTIVSYHPNLFSISDVHKTLAPRIGAFQDLGLSGPDLGRLLAHNPIVLSRRLETHIKPLIESLRSILGSDKNVVRAVQRSHFLLSTNVTKRLIPNSNLLRSYGLSQERIIQLVLNNPWNLICKPELLDESMRYVELKIGISRESQMFIHGVDACICVNKRIMELKFGVFKSYGWTEEDIMRMARKWPCCLKVSEAKIRRGLDFFMKELGYTPEYISTHPKLLMYSLENRVLPRRALMTALEEKKLIKSSKLTLYTILCITDRRFLDDYVLPYKDELPRLCEAYINKRLSDPSMAVVM